MKSQRFWLPVSMVAASFLGGGLANMGLAGKDPDVLEVVRAKRFQVLDDNGKVRGGSV